MISLNMLCSDTFPTMPIKHLRRGCFVTHSKITICYPLIINAKHGYIENFHQYFFNLPPDDTYIKWSLGKALYMADNSALKQKQAMEERNFFSDLVSSSASCMVVCDSIILNEHTKQFDYYGTQIIKRRTNNIRRQLHTSGYLSNVQRSENNPHGLLIYKWKTLENADLQH